MTKAVNAPSNNIHSLNRSLHWVVKNHYFVVTGEGKKALCYQHFLPFPLLPAFSPFPFLPAFSPFPFVTSIFSFSLCSQHFLFFPFQKFVIKDDKHKILWQRYNLLGVFSVYQLSKIMIKPL